MQKEVDSVELTKQKKNQALLSIIIPNNTTLLMVIIKMKSSNKSPHTDFLKEYMILSNFENITKL